jgi:hypothetical protein
VLKQLVLEARLPRRVHNAIGLVGRGDHVIVHNTLIDVVLSFILIFSCVIEFFVCIYFDMDDGVFIVLIYIHRSS